MNFPLEDASQPLAADAATLPVEPRRPGIWSGLGIVALYFALQLALSIVVGFAIGLVLALRAGIVAGMHHQKVDAKAIANTMMSNPDIRVLLTVVTIVLAAATMAFVVHRIWPAQWSRATLPGFGLVQPERKLAYLGAVLLGFAALIAGGMLTRLLAGHHPVHQDVTVIAHSVSSTGMRVLLGVMAVCVAPFVEELVFRGVLLSGLARRMPVAVAVVISAVIFGCVHLPDFGFAWYPIPALILLGLLLGWMRVRTGSLWPSIAMHATNNLFAALAWIAATYRPH